MGMPYDMVDPDGRKGINPAFDPDGRRGINPAFDPDGRRFMERAAAEQVPPFTLLQSAAPPAEQTAQAPSAEWAAVSPPNTSVPEAHPAHHATLGTASPSAEKSYSSGLALLAVIICVPVGAFSLLLDLDHLVGGHYGGTGSFIVTFICLAGLIWGINESKD